MGTFTHPGLKKANIDTGGALGLGEGQLNTSSGHEFGLVTHPGLKITPLRQTTLSSFKMGGMGWMDGWDG